MKLKKLTLHNFKGIKDFELDADGQDVSIFGENATGKTTICDSLYWLLFDKDSHMKKAFEIKTLDKTGEAKHGLNHEVEGAFIIDGGEINLKKSYSEIWTKKRGDAKKTFTGHTTDYFVDGVPAKKKEYTEKTKVIFNEETFKLLTTPSYFSETLPWKERREILLKVCGDISDDDVIGSDKKLKDLRTILDNHTIEDHKKIIAMKRTEINKELERIPIRIDEVARNMADTSGIEIEIERSEIKVIKKQISEQEKQINRIESGGEVAEKTKQLREIEGKLLQISNEKKAEHSELVQTQREKVTNLQSKHSDVTGAIEKTKKEFDLVGFEVGRLEKQIVEMRQNYHGVDATQFHEPATPTTCPSCGQDIPESQIEETIEKALSEFNLNKSNRLEQINKDGKKLKTELDAKKTIWAVKNDEIVQLVDDENPKMKALSSARKELELLQEATPVFDNDPEYKRLNKKGVTLVKEIDALENGSMDEVSIIKSGIVDLEKSLLQSEMKVLDFENSEKGKTRIEELEKEEKELAETFENIESELFLIESFTRKKVEMLDEKINSRFKLARFKMFKNQINEGLAECCSVTYDGVPFENGLNDGAKITVGLDIITTLQDHYKSSPFVMIDNRESITSLPDMKCQMISFVVSAEDEVLRVVVNQEVRKAA